jgi:hypothetical protein
VCLQQCLGDAQTLHLAVLAGEKDIPEILLQHHCISILYPIEGNRYRIAINIAMNRFIIKSKVTLHLATKTYNLCIVRRKYRTFYMIFKE